MARRWFVRALAALSLAVLAAGIIATGGPAQGRAERRDQARQRDLSEIQSLLACKAQQAGRVGTDPTPTEACPMTPRLADPFTGAPYRIEQVAPDTLRLCAGFELPPEAQDHGPDASGCMVQRVVPD
ncbi:hypothetical protein GIY56_00010 [Paracoccus sp. YIM 132242]|uniref:Uncharacterized protein n=1 Tax=Paracoccus lichenicola TaxID=2665644 RepID=A0A6L6HKA6_9RHOB|nr:hypothetical protein [Paracoccus lichenicola]MTD98670.1 hypothetical protein [Paracoccus lichenicola]